MYFNPRTYSLLCCASWEPSQWLRNYQKHVRKRTRHKSHQRVVKRIIITHVKAQSR